MQANVIITAEGLRQRGEFEAGRRISLVAHQVLQITAAAAASQRLYSGNTLKQIAAAANTHAMELTDDLLRDVELAYQQGADADRLRHVAQEVVEQFESRLPAVCDFARWSKGGAAQAASEALLERGVEEVRQRFIAHRNGFSAGLSRPHWTARHPILTMLINAAISAVFGLLAGYAGSHIDRPHAAPPTASVAATSN